MFFGKKEKEKADERPRVLDVMRLRQAQIPEPMSPEAARDFEDAKRRCLACNYKKLCDEALAAGNAGAFSTFCLNSHYIQQLRGRRLSFG